MSAFASWAKRREPRSLTAESIPSIRNFQSGRQALTSEPVRSRTVRTGYGSPVASHARLSAGRTTQCIAETTALSFFSHVPFSRQPTLSIFCM